MAKYSILAAVLEDTAAKNGVAVDRKEVARLERQAKELFAGVSGFDLCRPAVYARVVKRAKSMARRGGR